MVFDRRQSDGYMRWCKECDKILRQSRKTYHGDWRKRNASKLRDDAKRYYAENSEVVKTRVAVWRRENHERYLIAQRCRRIKNVDRFRKYARDWVKRNPGKSNEATARLRVAEFKATPIWIDRKKIHEIYAKAAQLTRETGIAHAVDHIVPLRSKIVCGLHWHGNLQILTKSQNSSKGNRHWPDMP